MTFDKSEGALVECQGEAHRVAYGFSPFPGAHCVPVDSVGDDMASARGMSANSFITDFPDSQQISRICSVRFMTLRRTNPDDLSFVSDLGKFLAPAAD